MTLCLKRYVETLVNNYVILYLIFFVRLFDVEKLTVRYQLRFFIKDKLKYIFFRSTVQNQYSNSKQNQIEKSVRCFLSEE